ncbi:hypothetical protein GPK34_00595 [Secundilactobacillus kimchicus]|uniref:hypothetical protein n=1 Tax=Secundilactobacillus kimchicus TaxID=528209 RepID=UPI001C00F3F8|nr:hypothetical protein [Secundilactobacillus kimchicus]MBT9670536.1 hypothetical protein [Secundilactobacillus kimchicus]
MTKTDSTNYTKEIKDLKKAFKDLAYQFDKIKNPDTPRKDELQKVYMNHVSPALLTKEDQTAADDLGAKGANLREVLDLLDFPIQTIQKQYSNIAEPVDVINELLRSKLGITEADYDVAEETVKKKNEAAMEELTKNFLDKVKEVSALNAKAEGDK